MKKLLLFVCLSCLMLGSSAQFYVGSDGISFGSHEIFSYEGFSMTSSSTFTLASTALNVTEAYTISPAPGGANYIKRYYRFDNTTPEFTGTVRFSYLSADLNGIAESDLRLNIRTNSTTWNAKTDLPNTTDDYLESSLTATTLNILAVASANFALPVDWMQFTGYKNKSTHALIWSTSTESNTQDFWIQHSTDGMKWFNLGTVRASGNASSRKDYNYTHFTPMVGNNHYRILQRDLDGKHAYSKVVVLQMDKSEFGIKIYPNPVTDGKLHVIVQDPGYSSIIDASGKRLHAQWLHLGHNQLDVSDLSSGIYSLKMGNQSFLVYIK